MIDLGRKELEDDVAFYGLELVRSLGVKEPPINEYLVAEFIGYDIELVYPSDYKREFPGINKSFCTSSAHMVPSRNKIYLNADLPLIKRRSDVFHEASHGIIPHHLKLNFNYKYYNLNKNVHKRIEREASHCGAEIQMPRDLFVPDASELEVGIGAIQSLAMRYQASLETTAIQYVKTSRSPCALVVVESRGARSYQLPLSFREPEIYNRISYEYHYPFQVKYAIKSCGFRGIIRHGIRISSNTPIYDAWMNGSQCGVKLAGSIFNPATKEVYYADIFRQGKRGAVLILLWPA
jgi:hypothetical protein